MKVTLISPKENLSSWGGSTIQTHTSREQPPNINIVNSDPKLIYYGKRSVLHHPSLQYKTQREF